MITPAKSYKLLNQAFILCLWVTFPFLTHAQEKDIQAGPVHDDLLIYQHAVYLTEPVYVNPEVLAKKILVDRYPFFTLTETPDPVKNSIRILLIKDAQSEYRPPDSESLKYFSKGLTKNQGEKLINVTSVLTVDFAIPYVNRADGILKASQFIAEIASETRGVIWDEETRQCFGIETWTSMRIDSFQNSIPDISKHITAHAYQDGEYIRSISLGMVKFGLPDIEISDFPWSYNRSVSNVINLLAQSLYENGIVKKAGQYSLAIDQIQHDNVRSDLKENLYDNAVKDITIHIIQGIQDEGDPDNRIIEIVFDHFEGNNKQEQMEDMFSRLWGWEDDLVYVQHNREILKASERAKSKLPAIKEKISKGLAPGEYYMLKAPFATPSGENEWMWVEVITWKNDIHGILKNQPFNIPDLKAGAQVIIKESDVFDYIHRLADGTSEGNETEALIQKYSK